MARPTDFGIKEMGDFNMSYTPPTCEILSFERDDVIKTSYQTPVIPFSLDDEIPLDEQIGWF